MSTRPSNSTCYYQRTATTSPGRKSSLAALGPNWDSSTSDRSKRKAEERARIAEQSSRTSRKGSSHKTVTQRPVERSEEDSVPPGAFPEDIEPNPPSPISSTVSNELSRSFSRLSLEPEPTPTQEHRSTSPLTPLSDDSTPSLSELFPTSDRTEPASTEGPTPNPTPVSRQNPTTTSRIIPRPVTSTSTPTPPTTIMASTARYSHTAADAPRFDDTDMGGLPMFLRDLEIYLKDHGITSDQDKIAKAPLHTKYSRTRVLWEELALIHKDDTWDEFVEDVIAQYPEIAGQQSGTLAELTQICTEFRGLSEQDGVRGNTFLRRFVPCVYRLGRSHYKISNFEACSRLASVCTPQFLATLDIMLVGKSGQLDAPGKVGQNPPVHPTNTSIVDGGYRWEDIVATMREVWRRGFTAAQNAISDAYPIPSTKSSTPASQGTYSSGDSDTRLVKLEQEFHDFAERATQGEKETKTAIRSLQTEVHTELAQGRTKADQNFAMIQDTIQHLTNQLALNTTSAAPQGGGARPNYPGPYNRPQNNYAGGQRNFPRPQFTCNWCGEIGHFMNNCPDCQNAIKSGEIIPDGAGGFRTKSGEVIPRRNGPMDVPMRTKWQQLKAAVNKYIIAPVTNFVGQYGESGMWGVPQQQPSVVLDSGMDAPPGWDEYTESLTPEQIAHYNNPPVGEVAQAPPDQESPSQGF